MTDLRFRLLEELSRGENSTLNLSHKIKGNIYSVLRSLAADGYLSSRQALGETGVRATIPRTYYKITQRGIDLYIKLGGVVKYTALWRPDFSDENAWSRFAVTTSEQEAIDHFRSPPEHIHDRSLLKVIDNFGNTKLFGVIHQSQSFYTPIQEGPSAPAYNDCLADVDYGVKWNSSARCALWVMQSANANPTMIRDVLIHLLEQCVEYIQCKNPEIIKTMSIIHRWKRSGSDSTNRWRTNENSAEFVELMDATRRCYELGFRRLSSDYFYQTNHTTSISEGQIGYAIYHIFTDTMIPQTISIAISDLQSSLIYANNELSREKAERNIPVAEAVMVDWIRRKFSLIDVLLPIAHPA